MCTVITVPKLLTSITGDPKSGKTHLAFTWPGPIKLYSFDIGADYVRTKFKDKEIDIHNFYLPIIDEDPPPPYAEPLWNEFQSMFKKDLEEAKYQTLVIDTATALWAILHQAITEEKGRKRILEVEYFKPNLKMSALFARARGSNVNLVTTQYLRDKYVDEKNSGIREIDGWKRTGGQVDVDLWIESVDKGESHFMKTTLKANRFDRLLNGKTFNDLTHAQLVAVLGV